MDKEINCIGRLQEAFRHFSSDKYDGIIGGAYKLFVDGKIDECLAELGKLPTKEQLLNRLVEKLKGKSVEKTLLRISNEGVFEGNLTAKGISSLLTHVIIESEKNPEYLQLVPLVSEELMRILYSLVKS